MMASRAVKAINRTYHNRYTKKSAKGLGIYAGQLPGLPRGIHSKTADPCQCGRCS